MKESVSMGQIDTAKGKITLITFVLSYLLDVNCQISSLL